MKVIDQVATFPISAAELFAIYTDAEKHSAATKSPAVSSAEVGADFSAHNGFITGKSLSIVPSRLVVQSWRGRNWKKSDLDSTLILTFSDLPHGDGQIHLVHVNVPDHAHDEIAGGWEKAYWTPWRAYLKNLAAKERE